MANLVSAKAAKEAEKARKATHKAWIKADDLMLKGCAIKVTEQDNEKQAKKKLDKEFKFYSKAIELYEKNPILDSDNSVLAQHSRECAAEVYRFRATIHSKRKNYDLCLQDEIKAAHFVPDASNLYSVAQVLCIISKQQIDANEKKSIIDQNILLAYSYASRAMYEVKVKSDGFRYGIENLERIYNGLIGLIEKREIILPDSEKLSASNDNKWQEREDARRAAASELTRADSNSSSSSENPKSAASSLSR